MNAATHLQVSTPQGDAAVSLSMPVRKAQDAHASLHPIFQMNLPEGFFAGGVAKPPGQNRQSGAYGAVGTLQRASPHWPLGSAIRFCKPVEWPPTVAGTRCGNPATYAQRARAPQGANDLTFYP